MLLSYLPEFMQDMKEIKVLLNAEEGDVEVLKLDIEDVFKDQYFLEATENGLRHYEEMLGIVPKLTDSIEARRFRLLARFNEGLPYTEITLNRQLTTLCGEEGYSLEVIFSQYRVICRVALASKAMFNEVKELLNRMLPANLIRDLDLMYNQHLTIKEKGLKHMDLRKTIHIDIRNEVI